METPFAKHDVRIRRLRQGYLVTVFGPPNVYGEEYAAESVEAVVATVANILLQQDEVKAKLWFAQERAEENNND